MRATFLSVLMLVSASQSLAQVETEVAGPAADVSTSRISIPTSTVQTTGSVRLEPTLGLTYFDLSGNKDRKVDTGFAAGLMVDLGRSGTTYQTGILYMQTGSKSTVGAATQNLNLNYLAFPLLAKYNFSRNPSSSLFAKGGMTAMYLMDGSSQQNTASVQSSQAVDKSRFADGDVLVTAGLGYAHQVAENSSLIIDATFNRGVIPVIDGGNEYNQGVLLSVSTAASF